MLQPVLLLPQLLIWKPSHQDSMLYKLLPKVRCYLNTALSGINNIPIRHAQFPVMESYRIQHSLC